MKKTSFIVAIIIFCQPKMSFTESSNLNLTNLPSIKNQFYNEITLENSTKYDFGTNIIEKNNDIFILFDKNLNEIGQYDNIIPINFNNNIGYLVQNNNNYSLINKIGSTILDDYSLNINNSNEISSLFLVEDNIILIKNNTNSLDYKILNNKSYKELTIPYSENISNSFITPTGEIYNLSYLNNLTSETFDKVEFKFDSNSLFCEKHITTISLYKNNIQKGFGLIDNKGHITNIFLKEGSYTFDNYSNNNYMIVKDQSNNYIYFFNSNGKQLLRQSSIKEYKYINDILVLRTKDEFIFLDKNGYVTWRYKTKIDISLDFYKQNKNTIFLISDNNKVVTTLLFDENQKLISSKNSIKDTLNQVDNIKPSNYKPLDVYFNGNKVFFFNSSGFLKNGSSYVPLRELAFLTNSNLYWDNKSKEIVLSPDDDTIIKIKNNNISLYREGIFVKTFNTDILNYNNTNIVKISDFKELLDLNMEFKDNSLYLEKS